MIDIGKQQVQYAIDENVLKTHLTLSFWVMLNIVLKSQDYKVKPTLPHFW